MAPHIEEAVPCEEIPHAPWAVGPPTRQSMSSASAQLINNNDAVSKDTLDR